MCEVRQSFADDLVGFTVGDTDSGCAAIYLENKNT
jgi:hypothetical protein